MVPPLKIEQKINGEKESEVRVEPDKIRQGKNRSEEEETTLMICID